MHSIDWLIVLGSLAIITGGAIYTNKYVQSVADFLAANRCAGRYMLCVATGMSGLGAAAFIATFQMYYVAGFTAQWWYLLGASASVVITLTGWGAYRYRETRALTLAQFFEVRYSKRFRVFAGILAWFAGIINFGIFPAIGAKFFIYFCDLPHYHTTFGSMEIDLVYVGVMIALLSISLFFVFVGGQIAIMVTDFIQGAITNVGLLIIMAILLWKFDWAEVVETLISAAPSDASLLDPNRSGAHEGFNPAYFFIGILLGFYAPLAWQGSQGYFCSGISAHEQRMAGILSRWRDLVYHLAMMLIPIGAFVVMHSANPEFALIAADTNQSLEGIDNEAVRHQMIVPVVMAKLLPTGIMGVFCAVMLAAFISTHDTYLHSWGAIFVQDVILPFRKKPFTPRQHIWLLRLSILFVAVFILFFSLFYQQNEYILMFQAITGAIFIGGAGAAIVGGLYWKRGTTVGAWMALIVGAITAIGTMILRYAWPEYVYPWMETHAPNWIEGLRTVLEGVSDRVWFINWSVGPERFPIDSQWMFFFSVLLALFSYVSCSLVAWLVFGQQAFDIERMLHRGKYAIKGEHAQGVDRPVTGLRAILPSKEFTLGDKLIYYSQLAWCVGWAVVIVATMIYLQYREISILSWANFWWAYVLLSIVLVVLTSVWLLVGGAIDMKELFRRLSQLKRDDRDMGMVIDHHNLTDEPDVGSEASD